LKIFQKIPSFKIQKKWFLNNSYNDCIDLIGESLEETKINLFKLAYNEGICKNCGIGHEKLLAKSGWRGWAKTCSEICKNKLCSKVQTGKNNSCHKMTEASRKEAALKTSNSLKSKIINGEYTPKSENYMIFGMLEFRINEKIKKVRSSWELIFWLNNEHLEYEKIRIEYFDSVAGKNRVYITDFYDKVHNKIIEIKPKKYQNINFQDKKNAAIKHGYNFEVIDETYFNNCKSAELSEKIQNSIIGVENTERRLQWLKKTL
jgi:hypothetical protein